jgi:hypothetical protein
MKYTVTKADGSVRTIDADYFQQDGSALRLFKSVESTIPNPDLTSKEKTIKVTENRLVASFVDGSYKSCEPE